MNTLQFVASMLNCLDPVFKGIEAILPDLAEISRKVENTVRISYYGWDLDIRNLDREFHVRAIDPFGRACELRICASAQGRDAASVMSLTL